MPIYQTTRLHKNPISIHRRENLKSDAVLITNEAFGVEATIKRFDPRMRNASSLS
jgi:hypothetical protein